MGSTRFPSTLPALGVPVTAAPPPPCSCLPRSQVSVTVAFGPPQAQDTQAGHGHRPLRSCQGVQQPRPPRAPVSVEQCTAWLSGTGRPCWGLVHSLISRPFTQLSGTRWSHGLPLPGWRPAVRCRAHTPAAGGSGPEGGEVACGAGPGLPCAGDGHGLSRPGWDSPAGTAQCPESHGMCWLQCQNQGGHPDSRQPLSPGSGHGRSLGVSGQGRGLHTAHG